MSKLSMINPLTLWRRLTEIEAEIRQRIDQTEVRLDQVEGHFPTVDTRLDASEALLGKIEGRFDGTEKILADQQQEIENLRSVNDEHRDRLEQRLEADEARIDGLESGQRATAGEVARLRDQVLPVAAERVDLLLERMMSEVDEVASLVERLIRREPLPVPQLSVRETEIAGAMAVVQPLLVEALRGSEQEIQHRLARHLAVLAGCGPVLDLGSGRGELLALLREAGVEAAGVEADPALAGAARRRGLVVIEGDVLEVLKTQESASRGAVTAIHLFEHLESGPLLAVLAEVRRVLRPGGVLLVECPDPSNLRVASLFWLDPTHQRPLHADTLHLMMTASGFEVAEVDRLHPFPREEQFASLLDETVDDDPQLAELRASVARVCSRLDGLMNGPRDFAIRATKQEPENGSNSEGEAR